MNVRRTLVYTLLLSALSALFTNAAKGAEAEPRVEVELLAEHTALVPGESTQLAVAFKIEPGWHIYWQNRGEGGLETIVNWHLPEGYEAGRTRFPPPRRHVDATIGTQTFILEGEPVILTTVSVPASARPGEKVQLGADVEWLVCKEVCIAGQKSLSIELPVVADATQAEASDPLTFKIARSMLPTEPDAKPKYLKSLSAMASVDRVRPGDHFEVAVVVEVQPDHHINSNKPLSKNLIPTDLFHTQTPGLKIDRPVFPPGKLEQQSPPANLPLSGRIGGGLLGGGEQVSLYRGQTVIRIPVTAQPSLSGDTVRMGGVVTYQACSDLTNQCFPPVAAEWELTLPVAAEGETVRVVELPGGDQPAVAEADPAAPIAPDESHGQTDDRAVVAQTSPPGGQATGGEGIGLFSRVQKYLASFGLAGQLLVAFVGGLLLNLMPCVLPVISIKILSFVQQAGESRLRVLTLGLAFAAGILVSFIVLGLMILGLLRSLGLELQWGGLFQIPLALITLAAVVTALALSLFGVFTLSPPQFILDMGGRVEQEGHVNAFAMGLLATVLGTACTAPFLSGVVAWSVAQPPTIGMLIFVTLGVGMALPYVLLAAQPAWIKFIPRPGPWMETFEHVMGFLLLGTAVFLLYPLSKQLGAMGLFWTVVFLLFVATAAWCYGRAGFGSSPMRQAICYSGTALLIVGGWWASFGIPSRIPDLMAEQQARIKGVTAEVRTDWPDPAEIPWVPYVRERTLDLVKDGKTVFIDYTADWCVNCKYNEHLVIDTPEVREAMRRMGVVPVKADFTLRDPEIAEDLERFNRAGVPMYVILPAGRPDQPILLDEILTQSALLEGLKKAGPSEAAALSVATAGQEQQGGEVESFR